MQNDAELTENGSKYFLELFLREEVHGRVVWKLSIVGFEVAKK